jgi:hypothetical protein
VTREGSRENLDYISTLNPSCAREPGVEKSGDRARHIADRKLIAPIAIDENRHRDGRVAGAERDAERTAVVLELRLAIAVPDDDDPRALARSSSVGQIAAHAGDDRL